MILQQRFNLIILFIDIVTFIDVFYSTVSVKFKFAELIQFVKIYSIVNYYRNCKMFEAIYHRYSYTFTDSFFVSQIGNVIFSLSLFPLILSHVFKTDNRNRASVFGWQSRVSR